MGDPALSDPRSFTVPWRMKLAATGVSSIVMILARHYYDRVISDFIDQTMNVVYAMGPIAF